MWEGGSFIKKKQIDKGVVIGVLIMIIITCFTWVFSYINEPVGDDLLTYYDGAIAQYLDGFSLGLGERITNPIQVLKELRFIYRYWSGRMIGYSVMLFGKFLPKVVQAFITAIVFSANILLAMRIVFDKLKNVVKSPVVFCLMFFTIYYYRSGCYYEYMWTMVAVYSIPIFIILLYYNLFDEKVDLKATNGMGFMQIIGFVAGFSHEILSLILIVIVGSEYIRDCILKNCRWTRVFSFTGLGFGYLLCFLAPGNFYRTTQSHDIVANTYADRLKNIFILNRIVLTYTTEQRIVFGILSIVTAATVIIIILKKEELGQILLKRVGIIIACCLYPFICAAVPHYPIYGEDLWIYMIYILCLNVAVRIRYYFSVKETFKFVLPVLLIVFFGVLNYNELYTYAKTSYRRRLLVREAVKKGEGQVVVPCFDEGLSQERYLLSYLNDQNQYDLDYYQWYYGTRLVIEKP